VRYSQEFEFITIFKQCLSNFASFLTNCSKINAKSGNIHPFTDFILRPWHGATNKIVQN
jgi:hypothetical protein